MKKVRLISALALALSLSFGLPALAKPPGGIPPGQAKKIDGGAVVSSGIAPGEYSGPPPWAPAHGNRAKHQYRYWPARQIYFDPGQSLYFWFSNGQWQAGARLPGQITLGDGYLTLGMDTATPYTWHSDVILRYPPPPGK